MTDITPIIPGDRQVIDSYGPGRFRVSSVLYETSVLIFPDRAQAWSVTEPDELTIDALAPVVDAVPPVEVLLIGCGPRMVLLPPDLRATLRDAGFSADVMETGAACRTYNVLLAEERRVAAALIAL